MVAGAAGNKDKSPTPLDLFDVVLQSTQDHWKSKPNTQPIIIFHVINNQTKKKKGNAETEDLF